jgi:hypothetical protein
LEVGKEAVEGEAPLLLEHLALVQGTAGMALLQASLVAQSPTLAAVAVVFVVMRLMALVV